MSDDAKDAGLVAMISSILGGGKRADAAEVPVPAEWIPTAPASQPVSAVPSPPQDAPAAAAAPAGQPATPQGKRRLPAEAIAELVLGELRKIDNFPASGASVTVYGYRHWNAMITFAPFSTTFENATRIRQAMPDLVFKLRRFVELEI
jgi:hypothetical protein